MRCAGCHGCGGAHASHPWAARVPVSIILALLIDRWWGEPPARFHPVVWMGSYLKRAGRGLPDRGPRMAFFLGTLYWLAGAALVAAAYGVAGAESAKLPPWLDIVLTAVLLKPLFALRLLLSEVGAVESSLMQGVECGRARLAHIVSRVTAALDSGEVRESSLESLAENLSDSIIAPLFWFALFGLPGAAVYRFANTADAMWGYRGRWEWAGKWAARGDDVLSYIPARLTVVLLAIATWHWPSGLRQIARVTPSPNGGWPMGMLALALNVRLSKPGVYVLNFDGEPAVDRHLWAALRTCERAAR